jgi:glycogen operon protein
MNMYWEGVWFELPELSYTDWHVFANTGMTPPDEIYTPGTEPRLSDQNEILLGPRSVVILVGQFA